MTVPCGRDPARRISLDAIMQLPFVTGATDTAVRTGTDASAGGPCAHTGAYSNAGTRTDAINESGKNIRVCAPPHNSTRDNSTAPTRDTRTHHRRDSIELPSPTCLFRVPGKLGQQSGGAVLSSRPHHHCDATSSHDLNVDKAAQRRNERGAGKGVAEGLAGWSRRGSAGRSSSSPLGSGSNATSTTDSNATSTSSQILGASSPSP